MYDPMSCIHSVNTVLKGYPKKTVISAQLAVEGIIMSEKSRSNLPIPPKDRGMQNAFKCASNVSNKCL